MLDIIFSMMNNILQIIKDQGLGKELFMGNWGLEKENLRVTKDAILATTKHPEAFGNKLTHPFITTDFSESQIEIITPPATSINDAYTTLENMHDIVTDNIAIDEYLWPSSMPPIIPEGMEIPIANYGESPQGVEKMEYRRFIAERYGSHKQLICGIHYNFSFRDKLIRDIYKYSNSEKKFIDFKNDIYLKISRNLLKHQWILTYLLGANVAIHSSYNCKCDMSKFKKGNEYIFKDACSYRNSICGYRNKEDFRVSFDSLEENIHDMRELISSGQLNGVNEYYSPVRLKNSKDKNSLYNLEKEGIEYIELRMIDLNPHSKVGITRNDIYLIHLFILSSLFYSCSGYDKSEQKEAIDNQNYISLNGKNLTDTLKAEGISFISTISSLLDDKTVLNRDIYKAVLVDAIDKIEGQKKLYSHEIYDEVEQKGYIKHHLSLAIKNKEISKADRFSLKGYEDLELSTQILIKEALLKGLKVKILDRKENFVSVSNNLKTEYIKQATKTSLDSYSTALIMENKAITKKVLKDKKVSVPEGDIYTDRDTAIIDFSLYSEKKIVIKPNNTNFGIGITILEQGFSEKDYIDGLDLAFKHDTTILVEEFFPGNEYRFTIIDGIVSGILQRVPANVVGDGKSTIRELVAIKNSNPLRGTGYKTPLEKLRLGNEEAFYLKSHNKNPDTVPELNEKVFLRENSNISTGGDSIDFTDLIHNSYIEEAERAAKAVGANITGVDMMIKDIALPRTKGNSTIIELNFNPAIHIHCYPYKGTNRRLGKKVLEALGF